MINPLLTLLDRVASAGSKLPRRITSADCPECGATAGRKHRLAICLVNRREVFAQTLTEDPAMGVGIEQARALAADWIR